MGETFGETYSICYLIFSYIGAVKSVSNLLCDITLPIRKNVLEGADFKKKLNEKKLN